MALGFATLPLGPAELRALADGSYTIVDQAVRTPGLLIVQAPDEEAGGGRREATEDPAAGDATSDGPPVPDAPSPASRLPPPA